MIFCNNKTKCQAEYNGKCCIKNLEICRHRCAIEIDEKAISRLKELPEKQQLHIANKYYSGIKVWNGKKEEI